MVSVETGSEPSELGRKYIGWGVWVALVFGGPWIKLEGFSCWKHFMSFWRWHWLWWDIAYQDEESGYSSVGIFSEGTVVSASSRCFSKGRRVISARGCLRWWLWSRWQSSAGSLDSYLRWLDCYWRLKYEGSRCFCISTAVWLPYWFWCLYGGKGTCEGEDS